MWFIIFMKVFLASKKRRGNPHKMFTLKLKWRIMKKNLPTFSYKIVSRKSDLTSSLYSTYPHRDMRI